MSINVIIQSRMGSKRLPGKNLLVTKNNLSLIEVVIKQIKKIKLIDIKKEATSKKKENDILVKIAKKNKVLTFRGKENDTLNRFYNAAKKYKTKTIIRITSDCALVDANLIDNFIKIYKRKKSSYLSNTYHLIDNKFLKNKKSYYPDGLDIEIFDFNLLEKIEKKTPINKRVEGGVITPFLKKKNKGFLKKLKILIPESPYPNTKNLKLSIDTSEDIKKIREIFENFQPNIYFNFKEIINFLKKKHHQNKSQNQVYINKAKENIMGENMLLSKNHKMILPELWPTYFSKTKGIYVWDLNNRKFLDMSTMGVGTNLLGYSIKQIDNAVIQIIKKGNLSTLNCPEEVNLSEKLLELHPWFGKVKFARTGGEANSIAIRIARANTKNKTLLYVDTMGGMIGI